MIIQLYDCIVCKQKVGCFPNTPLEERFCGDHTEKEIKESRKRIMVEDSAQEKHGN